MPKENQMQAQEAEGKRIFTMLGFTMIGLICVIVLPLWIADGYGLFDEEVEEPDTVVMDFAFVPMEASFRRVLEFRVPGETSDESYTLLFKKQYPIQMDEAKAEITFWHNDGLLAVDPSEGAYHVSFHTIESDQSVGPVQWTMSVTWPPTTDTCDYTQHSSANEGRTFIRIDCDLNAT